jgi:hypothetical protein
MPNVIAKTENETNRKIKFDQETVPDACTPPFRIPPKRADDRLMDDTDQMYLKLTPVVLGVNLIFLQMPRLSQSILYLDIINQAKL